ncbi:hypothetical protein AM1_G0002 (plasmid) [Acaryochloris marina MBIC11017]|uniref:Uncharacterized protein n=1 Tax=Acaryochloris marina (strain MBIC 11017) TaxID=329726 RepID=A8ZQ96_ACAM1|nr:hypothetical protein AM1_G0002 [Acaryochloris marina MBIC11017]
MHFNNELKKPVFISRVTINQIPLHNVSGPKPSVLFRWHQTKGKRDTR